MAVEVVTSPPFGGKSRFAREQIEARERAGELGLILLSFTELFSAMFPGEQTALRDQAVADTGAPRATVAAFDFMVGAVVARELSGYVTTQSPRQAVALADRFGGPLLEVEADPGDVADRAETHIRALRRTVRRAALETLVPGCRRGAVTYFNEQSALVGRARVVRRGKPAEIKRPFDRALWLKGLTPRGREGLAELQSLGNPTPTPADLMSFLLRNRTAEG